MYSSTLSLTSGLDEVCGQHHAPAALLPGVIRYLLCRRLAGPQCWSRWYRKLAPSGSRSSDLPPRIKSQYGLSNPFKLTWFIRILHSLE